MHTYFYISPEKPKCPEKHIYKECGLSNPATCSNVAPFQDSECVSGCTCPEGNNIYTKTTENEVAQVKGALISIKIFNESTYSQSIFLANCKGEVERLLEVTCISVSVAPECLGTLQIIL